MACLARWGVRLDAELLCSNRYDRRRKAVRVRVTRVDGRVEGVTLSLVSDAA
jgi:hypothetical protein